MTCGIYKIIRKDTGQCYIGLSEDIEKRYREHANGKDIKHSRIDRAIRKHGEDKFDLGIIEELPNDRALLMKREEYWISHYNTYEDKNHYNQTPGGDFSPMKVPEIVAKISGENNPMKNPEIAAKVSKANSGKNHPMYGKKHSEKTIKKCQKHCLVKTIQCMVKNIHKKAKKKCQKQCQKHSILLDTIVFIKRKTLDTNKVLYGTIDIMRMESEKEFLALILKNLKKKSEPKD